MNTSQPTVIGATDLPELLNGLLPQGLIDVRTIVVDATGRMAG